MTARLSPAGHGPRGGPAGGVARREGWLPSPVWSAFPDPARRRGGRVPLPGPSRISRPGGRTDDASARSGRVGAEVGLDRPGPGLVDHPSGAHAPVRAASVVRALAEPGDGRPRLARPVARAAGAAGAREPARGATSVVPYVCVSSFPLDPGTSRALWRPRRRQVGREPGPGQPDHPLERARLLEQVTRTLDDREPLHARQGRQRLPVQRQDVPVEAADDQ
jgi:hypothetical protein